MESLIPNIIIGAFTVASVAGFIYVGPFFVKKGKYNDSVGSSRKQSELIGRRKK